MLVVVLVMMLWLPLEDFSVDFRVRLFRVVLDLIIITFDKLMLAAETYFPRGLLTINSMVSEYHLRRRGGGGERRAEAQ